MTSFLETNDVKPKAPPQPHVRDELLALSRELCLRIGFAAFSQDQRVVYWANTKVFNPGIGMQAHLDRPYNNTHFHVVAAHLIAYEEAGETSMLVNRDQPADLLDGNDFAISLRTIFSTHVSSVRDRLVGVNHYLRSSQMSPHEVVETDVLKAMRANEILLEGDILPSPDVVFISN